VNVSAGSGDATMAPITVKEEFSKDTKLKTEDIEHLRDWLSRQPHLPSGITGDAEDLGLLPSKF
jgi:hypothetical protein